MISQGGCTLLAPEYDYSFCERTLHLLSSCVHRIAIKSHVLLGNDDWLRQIDEALRLIETLCTMHE